MLCSLCLASAMLWIANCQFIYMFVHPSVTLVGSWSHRLEYFKTYFYGWLAYTFFSLQTLNHGSVQREHLEIFSRIGVLTYSLLLFTLSHLDLLLCSKCIIITIKKSFCVDKICCIIQFPPARLYCTTMLTELHWLCIFAVVVDGYSCRITDYAILCMCIFLSFTY